MKLHLLQPMGGAGMRFSQDVGFNVPKPLIPIHGKPFFYWAAKSITERMNVSRITFILLQEHIDNFQLDKEVLKYFPNAQIAVLAQQLNGPVLTCIEGLNQVDFDDDEALLINDCDHMLKCDELTDLVNDSDERFNSLVTFKSNEPCFSYVRYENGTFAGTVEKRVVSEDAICGAYMYRNAKTFLKAAESLLKRGRGEYNEFFLSDTYNILRDQGESVRVMKLDVHTSFGTPAEYREVIKPEHNKEFVL
jgi:dTDP-glucose pyrophosphorylase